MGALPLRATCRTSLVKTNINRKSNSYDCYIVSLDRTIGHFARNFGFYISLLNDAERLFGDKYRSIMLRINTRNVTMSWSMMSSITRWSRRN